MNSIVINDISTLKIDQNTDLAITQPQDGKFGYTKTQWAAKNGSPFFILVRDVVTPFGPSRFISKGEDNNASWSMTVYVDDEQQKVALEALDNFCMDELVANNAWNFPGDVTPDQRRYSHGRVLKVNKKSKKGATLPPHIRMSLFQDENGEVSTPIYRDDGQGQKHRVPPAECSGYERVDVIIQVAGQWLKPNKKEAGIKMVAHQIVCKGRAVAAPAFQDFMDYDNMIKGAPIFPGGSRI